MEGFRSRSYGGNMMQMEVYGSRGAAPPQDPYDLRSYSTSYASSSSQQNSHGSKEVKAYKGKGSSKSASAKGGWVFSDPEFQRKKRVASYKVYSVEGRMKGSLRRSFRWLKDRYTQVVYGWW